jgi:surface carbohydrate biosynthesis protein (TIGR04326 family)
MRDLPPQKKGLYLFENQAWERALIHAWRKNGHGQLIAVQHSMIRFWDLRYFPDPRTVRSSDPYPMPQADLVALNGKAAVDAYLSLDYPKQAIAECEALRYGHLNNIRAGRSSRKAKGSPVKVLIVGDYMSSANIRILQLLEAAAPQMSDSLAYTMKPHPNLPVKATEYPSLHLKVVTAPLGEILHDFDIAYCSNLTSAAVDAYLAGLPVVVVLDDTELNLSPLRGESGVSFVSTPEELAKALRTSTCECAATNPNPSSFFFLNPELPRWSHLLDS